MESLKIILLCILSAVVYGMRRDDIRQCTRDLLLVERAREWLLEQ
jgi:hypothetical protein